MFQKRVDKVSTTADGEVKQEGNMLEVKEIRTLIGWAQVRPLLPEKMMMLVSEKLIQSRAGKVEVRGESG